MAMKTASVGVGTALLSLITFAAGSALAGPVAPCSGPVCDTKTVVLSSPPTFADATTVENREPYDFLDSVHFQRSPHVSITRIHGLDAKADIDDSPIGFTSGCHPSSTAYCRSGGTPKPHVPVVKAPKVHVPEYQPPQYHPPKTYTPKVYRPIVQPPVVVAPPAPCGKVHINPCGQPVFTQGSVTKRVTSGRVSGRVVATGGGFDPSKFKPRIYGDPYTITPGIAHVPTSIVDRDPYRAQAVIDSGHARPNPWTPGGVTPALSGQPIGPHVPYPYSAPKPHFAYRATYGGGRYGLSQSQTVITQSQSGGRYGSETVCRSPHPKTGRPTCPSAYAPVKSRY